MRCEPVHVGATALVEYGDNTWVVPSLQQNHHKIGISPSLVAPASTTKYAHDSASKMGLRSRGTCVHCNTFVGSDPKILAIGFAECSEVLISSSRAYLRLPIFSFFGRNLLVCWNEGGRPPSASREGLRLNEIQRNRCCG